MVKITYDCDETGQTMTGIFRDGDKEGTYEATFEWEPAISDETEDPYGILSRLLASFAADDSEVYIEEPTHRGERL